MFCGLPHVCLTQKNTARLETQHIRLCPRKTQNKCNIIDWGVMLLFCKWEQLLVNLHCDYRAPCTQNSLHFHRIFDRDLQIFNLQHFFQKAAFVFNRCGNVISSCFNMKENWVLQIFILQWRLERIFIFVVKLKLASLIFHENQQGAPIINSFCSWNIVRYIITDKLRD